MGDRSGTIFKISPDREIFVFATLEPSLAAYHLAFSPAGELFVTGPTTSSFDRVLPDFSRAAKSAFFSAAWGARRAWRSIASAIFMSRHRSADGAASCASRRRREPNVVLGGSNIVGLALLPTHRAMIATNSALYTLDWDVEGLPLNG